MNSSRVVSVIIAVAVLAVISAGLIGSVTAASTSTASAPASAGHDSPVPTLSIGTAVSSAETETSRPVTETEELSAESNTTVIGTSPLPATQTATPTETSASTTTAEATPTPTPTSTDATSGVTNTTENTTETVTNTTDAVTNTTENTTSTAANTTGDAVENVTSSTTNSTENVTSALTNTTENTTSSVTNTTRAVVSTATNGSEDVDTDTVNLTVNASIATNGTLGIAAGGGGTATAGSSAATPGSNAPGAGDGVGTETGTEAGAVAARAAGPDQSNSTPPGVPSGSGAALGGLLVVGVTVAAASRQIATTTAAGQGRELAWAGRIARAHVAHTASSVRSHLARLPRLLVPLGYSRHDDSDPLEHEVRQALFEAVERSPGATLSSLADQSDVSMSTVRHHLRILEEENLVASERIRGNRRYFLRNESRPALVAALDDPATGSILRTLARTGPASVSDLGDDLGRDPSTISHHVSRLEDDGLVARERDGRTVQNSLGPVARRVLTQETSAQQRPVATE